MDMTFSRSGNAPQFPFINRKSLARSIALAVSVASGFPLVATASDKTVLTSLYESITANSSALKGWGSGEPCDGWKGVTCSANRVTELNIANLDLAGL